MYKESIFRAQRKSGLQGALVALELHFLEERVARLDDLALRGGGRERRPEEAAGIGI